MIFKKQSMVFECFRRLGNFKSLTDAHFEKNLTILDLWFKIVDYERWESSKMAFCEIGVFVCPWTPQQEQTTQILYGQ